MPEGLGLAILAGAASCRRRRPALRGAARGRLVCCAFPWDGTARMRLFLDTGDVAEWERLLPLGCFHGVTTNPVLLQRANVPCTISSAAGLLKKALAYPGIQEVMFQAWGEDTASLVRVASELYRLDERRVVVKLPLTRAGICAAAQLRQNQHPGAPQVRICMTACYSAKQGFIAAGLGAEYIAPYLGRMSDMGMEGLAECTKLQAAVGGATGVATRVLVASLRSAEQMLALAAKGLDTFTFSPAICDALLDVEATNKAAADFERAARESAGPAAIPAIPLPPSLSPIPAPDALGGLSMPRPLPAAGVAVLPTGNAAKKP